MIGALAVACLILAGLSTAHVLQWGGDAMRRALFGWSIVVAVLGIATIWTS